MRKAALLALAGTALLASTAQAVNDYDAGDLLLGVRAEGNPGVTQDILVNLGPASQFVETNTATIQVGPNLKTVLDGTYGASWPTRSDVFWSVSGTTGLSVVGSDGIKTLYATKARPDFNTAATSWNRESETTQGVTASKMSAMATVYNNGTLASGVLVQSTADVNSYASYMPGGTVPNSGGISFAAFNPSVEGIPGQVLDLFRMAPGTSGTPGVFVGRFTIYSNGSVVFTPRDGAGAAFVNVQIEQPTYTVTENVGNVTVKIQRSGDPLVAFDVTANTVAGTALAGTDYTAQLNQLRSFAANEGEKTLVVPILPRAGVQASRAFTVALSGPTNSVTLGTNDDATVTISESAPTTFALGASSFSLNENAGPLAVQVNRVGGSDTNVSVQITTTVGTATAADYTPTTQTVNFTANGTNTATVNIPITNDVAVEANETFTVKLQGPVGGSLGTPNSAPVTIIDPSSQSNVTDTVAPGVPTITSPLANALVGVNTGATLNITGTATDNKGVQKVEFRVTTVGGLPSAFTEAVLATPGGTSTAYTAAITPTTGTNTVEVKSTDFAGRVSTVVTRTFKVTRPLLVAISGTGTVTAGFSPTSFREVGKSLTITGTATTTPAPGTIFAGWEILSAHTPQQIGIATTALEKATLTFIFREGLSLRANFVANPFAGVAGTYNGLINSSADLPDRIPTGGPVGPEDGTLPSNSSEGFFNGTVQTTGAFSGKLTIDTFVLNVAGSFDHLGRARFGTARALTLTVPRPNKPSLVVKLDTTLVAPFKITGEVTAKDFKNSNIVVGVSNVDSDRAHYTGLTGPLTVPDPYLTVTGALPSPAGRTDGTFTVIFPAQPVGVQPSGFTTADYPQGDGVGTIKVTKAGVVTLTGTLADGTAVTASSTLSAGNRFALFAPLYTKLGFISGFVTLNNGDTESDMTALSDLLWSRPFQSTQQWYPYGWPEVITVGMDGARYINTAGQSVLKGANGVNINPVDLENGNADLQFSEGLLTEQITKPVSISTTNVVTKVPDNDLTFTSTIAAATGMVTGTFTHEDDTKPAYKAVIYQKGLGAGAYGHFLTTKPAVIDYVGESGWVTLLAHP